MEFVEPIKSVEQINAMKSYLKSSNLRDWVLFTLGINSGLRISDILKLTVEDVAGQDRISVKEQKSARAATADKIAKGGKTKDFPLSNNCKLAIREYLDATGLTTGVLFPSRKSAGSKGTSAISRQQAYDVINKAAQAAGVITKTNGIKVGTHSMRKSFGYHAYQAGVAIETIQRLLNHSAPSVTLRYIGMTKETLDAVYINLDL